MVKFHKVSDKDLLVVRNNLFTEVGIPALKENGFGKSPFSGSWFGKNNLGDFTYEMCRISKKSHLEIVQVHISKGDTWIKIYLNIFELNPVVNNCDQLTNIDGIKFSLPPNNLTKMRLRIDDYHGIPLFRTNEHKIGSYHTKKGYENRVLKLKELIKDDLMNIDSFVSRWYELHTVNKTDREGNMVAIDSQ